MEYTIKQGQHLYNGHSWAILRPRSMARIQFKSNRIWVKPSLHAVLARYHRVQGRQLEFTLLTYS